MDPQVAIVTGASNGIGKVTAIELAKRGHHVVLVCRDRTRGEAALAEVKAHDNRAELVLCDLGDLDSTRRAAKELESKTERLDVLVNNAGIIQIARETTAAGFEKTFVTNHLGPFLLTKELLPLLERSGSPSRAARIVNVSSALHHRAKLDLDDLNLTRRYGGTRAYANSKLMNILFANELARRMAGKGIVANSLHPGAIASNFGLNNGPFIRLVFGIARPFLLSVEKGARTTLHVATSPALEGVTGRYFDASREARPSRAARDEVAANRLWELSEGYIKAGRADPVAAA